MKTLVRNLGIVSKSIVLFCIASFSAQAAQIAIIGTGDVAAALGPRLADLGHEIVYGSRNPNREKVHTLVKRSGKSASALKPPAAAAKGDIIVLAVPGLLVAEITRSLGDLAGKIIIDPTNPLIEDEHGHLGLSGNISNTEMIQDVAPQAFVVKAFSTFNYLQMIDPKSSGVPISVILAGNNAEAKDKVAQLASNLGYESIDVGRANSARYIEGMTIIWLNNRIEGRQEYEYHLRKVAN